MYLLVSSQLLVAVLSTRGRLPRQLKLSLKRFAVSLELAYSTARWLSHLFFRRVVVFVIVIIQSRYFSIQS